MKRLITAVSLAVLAAPVLATPFEQTQFDRGLPYAQERTVVARTGAGETRSDREIAVNVPTVRSVWAGDHTFISPAK